VSEKDPRPTVPETLRKLVGFLEAQRVPYVLVGGIAAGLQGHPRLTDDVDFMITLPSSKVSRLAEAAAREGFSIEPELAETQWLASGFVRMWFGPPGKQVAADLMACNSDFLREASWRAQQTRCFGVQIPIATPEDMIIFKLAAWREKDVPDARAIFIRHEEKIDRSYLRRWCAWFAAKNPCFQEMPARLEALLAHAPLPPGRPQIRR
jgi:predicted nucleotidyltransferase